MAKYAIDCEMVGSHNSSLLARVTIVNQNRQVVFDEYVKPTDEITDHRSSISGVNSNKLLNGLDKDAVRSEVANILYGSILIGHSLQFDLDVLELSHPEHNVRDLAKYPPLMCGSQPVALKTLAWDHLNREIQYGQHDSAEDATACMDLYLKFAHHWERII